jgi:hypothetical protein
MALDHPTGRIIDQGTPLVDHYKIKTVANMYPGRLVTMDTTDNQIKVCTAATKPLGVLGYQDTNENFRPDTVDTIYEVNDFAAVLFGGGFTYVGRLASGQNVAAGEYLTAAADGELTAATVGTDDVVAVARESVDASGAAADILVASRI